MSSWTNLLSEPHTSEYDDEGNIFICLFGLYVILYKFQGYSKASQSNIEIFTCIMHI